MRKYGNNRWIVGVGMEDRSYIVNGVKYVVSSCFTPTRTKEKCELTLSDKLHPILEAVSQN